MTRIPPVDINRLARWQRSKWRGRAFFSALVVIMILFMVTFFFYT